ACCCFHAPVPLPPSHSFPTRRSSDLVVRLQMLGSCDGCPSSAVTLDLAVREALEAAAPEVTGIEVEEAPAVHPPTSGLIPVEARSEEHTSELQSRGHLVCRLLLEKKK